jgi:hypothetical protein
MKKHSNVTDPGGLIIPSRINDNFGFLNANPPELTITGSPSGVINVDLAATVCNVYRLNPSTDSTIVTINGGVVGQCVTLVNVSSYVVQINQTGNIRGIGGTVVMSGLDTTCTLSKAETNKWVVVSNTNNTILENVFGTSYGNAKDKSTVVGRNGLMKSSDYWNGATYAMGGEYWFDSFEIDQNIVVDASIGWLVIRANTVTISKAGGATIDGKGKSRSQGSLGTIVGGSIGAGNSNRTDTPYRPYGFAGMGGTGGSGGGNGSRASAQPGDCTVPWQIRSVIIDIDQAGPPGSNSVGIPGTTGTSIPSINFMDIIRNPANYAGGGSGGTNGNSTAHTNVSGGNGGHGGAGVSMYTKNLVLTNALTVDCSGTNGTGISDWRDVKGGSGGGGGSASSVISYVIKSGAGALSQLNTIGLSGTGDGANGGNGGLGLKIIIDDFAKKISFNGGSTWLPA